MELSLPVTIATRSDILRMYREMQALQRYFDSARARGQAIPEVPKLSKSLTRFIEANEVNIQDEIVLKTSLEFVSFLKNKAPVLHMSFASEPSAQTMSKLIAWMRDNIHPQVLIEVGLQPNIAGGCLVRSTNKVFDFSLRQHFAGKQDLLIEAIKNSRETIAMQESQEVQL